MTYEQLTALALFAFATSITPGPNNMMLMASGANFGFRRALPHMLGVSIGFFILVTLTGLGLGQIIEASPIIGMALKVISVLFMLFLAWKIATSASIGNDAEETGQPITFLQAAAFQWANPKAWAMALTAISVYATGPGLQPVLMVGLVFTLVNLPCVSSWTLLGTQIRRLLKSPNRLRIFNWTMAALLLSSLILILR